MTRSPTAHELQLVPAFLADGPHLGFPLPGALSTLHPVAARRRSLRALDIGCGFGRASVALALSQDAVTVLGLDRDPGMVARARRHVDAASLSGRCVIERADIDLDRCCRGSRWDIVLMFAAHEIYGTPKRASQWLRDFLSYDGVALVDATQTDLAGNREACSDHLAHFQAELSHPELCVEQVRLRWSITPAEQARQRVAEACRSHSDSYRGLDVLRSINARLERARPITIVQALWRVTHG